MTKNAQLLQCILRLAQLQNVVFDRLGLQEAIDSAAGMQPKILLNHFTRHLHLKPAQWLKKPDPSLTPALIISEQGEWGVLRGFNAKNQWVIEWWDGEVNQWNEVAQSDVSSYHIVSLELARPYSATNSPAYQLIRDEVFSHKRLLIEAVLGGVIINVIALATSFYTMQIYDRVVPTGATQTLIVLTLGVFVAIIYELITKKVRSTIYDKLINKVDQRLARSVYMRFLNVRLDQLPQSVGGLASQMRGYETVRSFLSSVVSKLFIDAPFALLFVFIIAIIAGPLAYIPLTFFVLSVLIGWYYRGKVDALADSANAASNFKTGLLVESVEGAETIKSGQGGWRMLSRWMNTTDEDRGYETKIRNVSEHSQYVVATFQQLSYIALVATGAILVSRGDLTMGGLIACSILSGRILAPVANIPSHLVQWAHTKAALKGLDALWALEDDHAGQEQPIVLESLYGDYRFIDTAAQYGENTALTIQGLNIKSGEKIGVLGPVGSGKTTFLRLLSGMYKPQAGRILLDDVELAHISKPMLAENIGFVQQEGRLFAGTLRENVTLGLLDPGDEVIISAARITGLLDAVISPHPKGLLREIYEGGTGLSGGQRQLVTLTRAFLRKPSIWLLDEPTASMDRNLEIKVLNAIKSTITPSNTLVVVTHKPEVLNLVERVIVIANNKIVMDGPKEQVLHQLQASTKSEE